MVVTDVGVSGDALLLTVSGIIPRWFGIGTGSKTESASVTSPGSEWTRTVFSSTDISTFKQVTWAMDQNSVQMSGCNLKEFYLLTGSPGNEIWHYVNFGNGITFDGTNELRIELTWKKYR